MEAIGAGSAAADLLMELAKSLGEMPRPLPHSWLQPGTTLRGNTLVVPLRGGQETFTGKLHLSKMLKFSFYGFVPQVRSIFRAGSPFASVLRTHQALMGKSIRRHGRESRSSLQGIFHLHPLPTGLQCLLGGGTYLQFPTLGFIM